MSRPRSRLLKTLAWTAGLSLLFSASAGSWAWWRLHTSLPLLDGQVRLSQLEKPVSVKRDRLGIPSIQAASETDAYRTLGWLHAQDRFFQMDLQRRRVAGELSELMGPKTLAMDRWAVGLEFRRFASAALAALPPDQRRLLEAYSEGVNAGLSALKSPPWEYTLLRADPRPWTPLDSLLCGYAMVIDLQDDGVYEKNLATLRDTLGQDAADFLAPLVAPDDCAVDGSTAPLPTPPGPSRINLRPGFNGEPLTLALPSVNPGSILARGPAPGTGSNAFAVSGDKTVTGAAMVANDMHLRLGVPNVWYRAVLSWPASATETRQLSGLTLPGLPLLVSGSNGQVAWGFTNSYADTSDLVIVEQDRLDANQYRRGQEWLKFEKRSQDIKVKGSASVRHEYTWCHWGPVVGPAGPQRFYALKWTALSKDAVDLLFTRMADVASARAAVTLASDCGLPALNMLVADRSGEIAWTIAGRLPQRTGYSGRYPIPHTYEDRRWEGTLPASRHPFIIAPAEGFLSSANERLFGGDILALLGDGGYASPARGRQLRNALRELVSVSKQSLQPRDLLALQLDDRALALAPWRQLLLKTLDAEALANHPDRARLRKVVENWTPNASPHSNGYRMVREFQESVSTLALDPITEPCLAADDHFNRRHFRSEAALWKLLETKPDHLLRSKYDSWETLLLTAADEVLAKVGNPETATWGQRNTARIQHPFSRLFPLVLSPWLDMPADELSGDNDMPRVTRPSFGASERFVVSPGHEDQGLCHMPCGQSANPLSPYYRAGHEAWVLGQATPFLPGPAEHSLTLSPP